MKALIAGTIADALAGIVGAGEESEIESFLNTLPTATLFSTPRVFSALRDAALIEDERKAAPAWRQTSEDIVAGIRAAIRKARAFLARQASFDFSPTTARADTLESVATIGREMESHWHKAERSDATDTICDHVAAFGALEAQALAILAAVNPPPTREEYADLEIPTFLRRRA